MDQAQRPIRVQVPGHGIVEFPAGTPEAEMREALMTLGEPEPTPQGAAPAPGLIERFLGVLGFQPNEKVQQYRDLLNSGGTLDEVLQRVEASEQRNGGVFRKADRETLPYVGGTVGGVIGGAPGAAFGGAAGEAVRQLDNRLAGSSDVPSTPMDAAKGIAFEGGVQGAIEGVAGAVPKLAGRAAHAVYRGYLKPSLAAAERAKAKEIVTTALEEALPISERGTAKASRLIQEINQQVNNELKNAGGFVDLVKIANRVRTWAKTRYNKPGAPPLDYEAALRVADEIDRHPSLGIPEGVTPTSIRRPTTDANETKQTLDRAIGDTGFGVERTAGTEARKVGRHAARTEIERVAPGVKPLNERESKIIDALDSLEGAVGRLGNTDKLMGVRTIGAGLYGAGAMSGGDDPVSALVQAVVLRGLVSPNVASRAAILASRFAKVPGTTPAFAARLGLILAQRESDEKAK